MKRHKHKELRAAEPAVQPPRTPATIRSIKAQCQERRQPLENNPWDAELFVRKIPAKRGVRLLAKIEAMPEDLNEETISTMAEVLSHALVNVTGEAIFDNDEGRAILEDLDIGTLLPMFQSAAGSLNPQGKKKRESSTTSEVPSA